jgi:hypothetical protein
MDRVDPTLTTPTQSLASRFSRQQSVVRFQSPVPAGVQSPVPVPPPPLPAPSQEPPQGMPLQTQGPPANTSWMYRPLSIGLAYGMLSSGTLIDDWVSQGTGSFGAIRLGLDLDDRWGVELRYGFGSVPLCDSDRAIAVRDLVDTNLGIPHTSEQRYDYAKRRNGDRTVLDLSVLLYPGGDKRWRPYFLVGLGVAQVRFVDALRERYSATVADMPLALGIKYLVAERLALRFEVGDTIVFGGGAGFNTVSDLTVTGGIELRLGGGRRSYWPWVPGDHAW